MGKILLLMTNSRLKFNSINMITKLFPNFVLGGLLGTILVSCGDQEVTAPPTPPTPPVLVETMPQKDAQIRDETINDLLLVKSDVRKTIDENNHAKSLDGFITDLESLRPRLEYIHLRTATLPKKEQMVVRGNLAVITNQLEKDLLAILAKAPGNDDLAVEIAHLREQLSPIPLSSILHTSAN
jgi:hypothetical protein